MVHGKSCISIARLEVELIRPIGMSKETTGLLGDIAFDATEFERDLRGAIRTVITYSSHRSCIDSIETFSTEIGLSQSLLVDSI